MKAAIRYEYVLVLEGGLIALLFITTMPTEAPEKMLFAALELFIAKGFKETSILDIVEVAHVSKTTFYQRFGNKEELLAHLCKQLADEILQEVESAVQSETKITEKAYAGIRRYIELCMTRVHVAQLLLVESVGVTQEVETIRRDALRRFANLFYETVHRELPDLISEEELRIFSHAMIGAINEVVVQYLFESGQDFDLDQLARLLNRIVVGTYVTLPR
jgi:AcrR family transcriptional regulator